MAEISLRNRALGLLSKREYCRTELALKLRRFEPDADTVDTLLDALETAGWLSDRRFAESYARQKLGSCSASRVSAELRHKGVDAEIVAEVIAELREAAQPTLLDDGPAESTDPELEAARNAWGRRFGRPPADEREQARQIRFLQARGFAFTVIRQIVPAVPHDEDGG